MNVALFPSPLATRSEGTTPTGLTSDHVATVSLMKLWYESRAIEYTVMEVPEETFCPGRTTPLPSASVSTRTSLVRA